MPVINDASWSSEGKWLRVRRIEFISQIGDQTEATVLYTSSNPQVYDTTVDPGAGILVWNNATPSLITQIAVSATDRDGGDQTLAWGDLNIGDQIIVRSDATNYYILDVAGAIITQGGWFQIPVSFVFAIGTITNNKSLEVQLTYYPESIPSGGDTLEIRMAQEWPWIVYRLFDPVSIVPKNRGLIPISDVSLIEMF